MAATIGARLDLQGEKEFRSALSGIDQNLKTLKSELELSSAKFAGQEKSVEGLTAKQQGLRKVYDQQNEKIRQLTDAVKRSTDKYGEADVKTLKWQERLNKARTEQEKTKQSLDGVGKELDDVKNSMDKAGEGGKGLGDMLDSLGGKFGISLPDNMKTSLNGMMQIDAKSLALAGGFAALVTAIVKVEKALIDMTKEAAAYADEILTTSTVTGIATSTLQEYGYAAELLDVDVNTLTGSQNKLIRSMQGAKDGAEAQTEAFSRLGVTWRNSDGSLRDVQAVFGDVINALGDMTNETERDAIAMELMGKSAQDLNPLIEAGGERMAELAEEAHNVGYVLDEEALSALGEVDDATQRYNRSMEALKNRLSVDFAPYLTEAMEKLTKLVQEIGSALKQSGVVDSFGMLLNSVVDIVAPTDNLSNNTIPRLVTALHPLAATLAAMADTIDFISGILSLDFGKVGKALGFGYSKGNYSNVQKIERNYQGTLTNLTSQSNGYGSYYANGTYYANQDAYLREEYKKSGYGGTFEAWKSTNGYNASGNDNWRGGMTWVGENGPELAILPRGTQILSAQESREASGDTFEITINVQNIDELETIVRMAREARMRNRKK